MAAAGLFGALQALGNFGNQLATADQANAASRQAALTAAQAAADRQAAADLKRKEFELKQQKANAKTPLGTPYVASGGKMVQRYYDPVSRTVTEEEIGGPAPETDAEKYKRSLISIGVSDADATKMTKDKYGPTPPKLDAEEQKKEFWKSLGFTDAEIKRMAGVEGGLYARPRILAAGGTGGPMTDAEIAAAAAERKNGVQPAQQGLSKPENERVVKYMLDHGIHQGNKPTANALNAAERGDSILAIQKRIYDGLNDPEIAAYVGPVTNPLKMIARSTGIGLPEKVSAFRNDLISYGAFLAGLHPVRGIGALNYFDQVMGGMGQTADTLRGKLDSNRAVVESVDKAANRPQDDDDLLNAQ